LQQNIKDVLTFAKKQQHINHICPTHPKSREALGNPFVAYGRKSLHHYTCGYTNKNDSRM
jgi:hypothetical protein